jgi:TP53 regulating kinase-like protein
MKFTEHMGRVTLMGLKQPTPQPFLNERMGLNLQKSRDGRQGMVFKPTQRLHLGAEAEVWLGEWFGQQAVRKQRRPRSWRHPDLDHRLGVRRMISEARLLVRTRKAGLSVPAVWDLDYDGGQLIIEHLAGTPLIDVLNHSEADEGAIKATLQRVGACVRRLHREATTHGDLSTNNLLVDGETIHLIDFGLASIEYDVEKFGIDLHVLDEILGASHPDWPDAIDWAIEGYLAEEERLGSAPVLQGGAVPSASEVIARLEEVRTRVRYHG